MYSWFRETPVMMVMTEFPVPEELKVLVGSLVSEGSLDHQATL